MTARLLNYSSAEYRSDPDKTPRLSCSIAKILLTRSPLHAWYAHPKLGGGRFEPTETMNRGSIIHTLLLGKGAKIGVINHDEYRTKEAKADRDAAIAAGQIPVKAKDYAELASAAERIRARIMDFGIDLLELGNVAEQAIEWEEAGARGPVKCRAMFDLVNIEARRIFDVKSIEDASQDSCARSVYRYDYHVQDAGYRSALTALTGEPSAFTFLFCELDQPNGVLPAKCSGAFREIGEAKWRHAVRLWEECLATGKWPGYASEVARLEPPGWAVAQMVGSEW